MPSLSEMLAKKSQLKQDSSGEQGVVQTSADRVDPAGQGSQADAAESDAHADGAHEVSSKPEFAPASKPQARPGVGGFKLGGLKLGAQPGVAKPAATSGTSSAIAKPSADSAGATPSPDAVPVSAGLRELANAGNTAGGADSGIPNKTPARTGLSLVDLAGIGGSKEGEVAGIELTTIDDEDGYLDQVPASAPPRELPEDLIPIQKSFVDSLDAIYRLQSDPEMFVDTVRKIMSEMQDNPDLVKLLHPQGHDSAAMIRGLRQQAGMAQVKKQESKAKTSKSKSAAGSKATSSAMESLMALGLTNTDGI